MEYLGKSSEEYSVASRDAFTKYKDSIFPTEGDFLHHLFSVIGNGYEWINGALIQEMYGMTIHTGTEEEEVYGKPKEKTITDWYYDVPKYRKLYGLCEHSKLCNIPEDIKPDWLDACKRAIILFKKYYLMTYNDAKLLDIAQETVEKIESKRGKNGSNNS